MAAHEETRIQVTGQGKTEGQGEFNLQAADKWEQGDPPILYLTDGPVEYGSFETPEALRIETYTWKVEGEAVGDIVVAHGLGTHCRHTYLSHVDYDKDGNAVYHDPHISHSFVEAMLQQGFNVHGYDMRSFGQSDGLNKLRGYFQNFQEHIEDLLQYSRLIRETEPKKLFLVGASIGGAVAVAAIAQEKDLFDGMIVCSPALNIDAVLEQPMNRVLLPVAGCIANVAPTLRLGSSAPNKMFPLEEKYLEHDPLCDRLAVRLWVGLQTLRWVPTINVEKVDSPFLVFHSENDTNAAIAGTEKLIKESKTDDKEFVRLTGKDSFHSLLVEPCRDEIVEKCIEWLLKRC